MKYACILFYVAWQAVISFHSSFPFFPLAYFLLSLPASTPVWNSECGGCLHISWWTWARGKVSHWYWWNKYEGIPKITKSVSVFSGCLSTLKLVLVTRNTKRRKKGKSSYLTCNNYNHITKCQVDLFCFFISLPWSFMLCSSNFLKEAFLSTLQIRKKILWWKNRGD